MSWHTNLLSLSFLPARAGAGQRPSPAKRKRTTASKLSIESLEERCMPAPVSLKSFTAPATRPIDLDNYQGKLFFAHGNRLWSSDGTTAGTRNTDPLTVRTPVVVGVTARDGVLFLAGNSNTGTREYTSTGTQASARNPGPVVATIMEVVGTRIALLMGSSLQVTTAAALHAWAPGRPSPWTQVRNFTGMVGGDVVSGNRLFFTEVLPGSPFGKELWASDLTPAGTRVVRGDYQTKPIKIATAQAPYGAGIVAYCTNEGIVPGVVAEAVCKTHDTPNGPILQLVAKAIDPLGPTNQGWVETVKGIGPSVYFFGNARGQADMFLWKSDGTENSAVKLSPRLFGGGRHLTQVGNKVFFVCNTNEVWMSDGTTAGTRFVTRVGGWSQYESATPNYLHVMGNKVYFTAIAAGKGEELWETDGTTTVVHDINPGTDGSAPKSLTYIPGKGIYFTIKRSATATELMLMPEPPPGPASGGGGSAGREWAASFAEGAAVAAPLSDLHAVASLSPVPSLGTTGPRRNSPPTDAVLANLDGTSVEAFFVTAAREEGQEIAPRSASPLQAAAWQEEVLSRGLEMLWSE